MPNFKVKAVYDYASPHEDDLSFPAGQIITVTEEEDADWYVGEYIDGSGAKQDGLFPKNFVEKYEPEPPPRPNRASRHKPLEQPASQPEPPTPVIHQQEAAAVEHHEPEPEPEHEPEPEAPKPQVAPVEIPSAAKSQLSPTSPPSATSARSAEAAQKQPPAPKPAPAAPAAQPDPAQKKSPPPVAAKSSSFRDRIAAFNQPAAAPIQPFKPGGGPPSTFIKKPFVAPPPSRNAYVPPPVRETPQVKSYRRDEDPEIAERQAQDQQNAEKAGLTSPTAGEGGDEEDQPKPTSLKERIALLQKQQAEQAQRAAALQKEKPKKPPMKKRTESHEQRAPEGDGSDLEKVLSSESVERGSMDHSRPRRTSHGMKSPDATLPNRELLSDANDADQSGAGETEDAEGTSTSVEEDDEHPKHRTTAPPARSAAAPSEEPDVGDEEGAAAEEEEEEEEDEMDAETRRKLELRQRMAKMSGGMGMPGMGAMFGPPGGLPMGGLPPKKKKPVPERKSTADSQEYTIPQARVPMIPVPGMSTVRSPEPEDRELAVEKDEPTAHPVSHAHPADEVPDVEEVVSPSVQRTPTAEQPPPVPSEKRPVPSAPNADRPAPPPVPSASRPVPPPAPVRSPSPGSESEDEMTEAPHSATSPKTPSAHAPSKRSSYLASDEMSQDSPDKRAPPIPLASPTLAPSGASRPPPPPPPTGAPPSRSATMDSVSKKSITHDRSEGETEYEGDYDTDIASGATHKEALKAHTREPSMDESTTGNDTPPVRSPTTPHGMPPIPQVAPRAVPPPPPQQPPTRSSVDAPRGAPPPPPVPTSPRPEDDDEYDPYNYSAAPPKPSTAPRAPPPQPSQPPPPQNRPPPPSMPPMPPMPPKMPPPPVQQAEESSDEDELYSAPPPRKSHDRPPPPPPQAPPPSHQHAPPLPHQQAPPPPPQERAAPPPPPPEPSQSTRAPSGRKSLDVNRTLQGRVSMDQPRPSMSQDFIASDIDLGASSHWWTQPNMPPPSLQGRKDVLVELDESRSGNDVEKAVFVLYMDYSQTVITARFSTNNVSDVQLEQRQDPPPQRLRQDQLENAHETYGRRIAKDVSGKEGTVVGDGTPHALIHELLRPYPDALRPVSTRSFGALVYANLANASTQQYDEIRPGDIISFRNAKFQGKHGAMHAKYSTEVGKPDHVAVVTEWDGTKKKVRAWEQGREIDGKLKKKVREDGWRMGDLRSGEVRIWRVMGRSWVGWNQH